MRSISAWFGSSLALLLLCTLPASSRVQAGERRDEPRAPQDIYEVCRQGVGGGGGGRLPVAGKGTMYFSGVMPRVQINDADYSSAFAAFLHEKYGIPQTLNFTPECGAMTGRESAERIFHETWKESPDRYNIVYTGWTYTPAVSTATPQAKTASTERVTYDCDGGPGAGGFTIVATYYFTQGQGTPDSASITVDGKTTELRRATDDPSGLTFAAMGMAITKLQPIARLYRNSKASSCVARAAPSPASTASSKPDTKVSARPTVASAAPQKQAPASTPAAGKSKAVYVICRADSSPGEPRFYNPPVDGGSGNYATWQPSFKDYLVQKHHFRGSGVGCGKYPTLAAAQTDYDQWIADARAASAVSTGPSSKVIVTDWKFE